MKDQLLKVAIAASLMDLSPFYTGTGYIQDKDASTGFFLTVSSQISASDKCANLVEPPAASSKHYDW